MNTYFKEITFGQGGDFLYWIASILPLFLWTFLIDKYKLYNPKKNKSAYLLWVPYIAIGFEIYTSWKAKGPTPPTHWNLCLSRKVAPKDKKKGVLGYIDYKCKREQNNTNNSLTKSESSRFYYVNYLLFFMVLIIQNFHSEIWRSPTGKRLVNILCISVILEIVGVLPVLFIGQNIWSILLLRIGSSALWQVLTLLMLFLIEFYIYIMKT